MTTLYILLLSVLLGTFGFALSRVNKAFNGLTPIMGWMIGLAYFFLAPLTILTLNGGFKFAPVYQMSNTWREVNITKVSFLPLYLVIWLSLLFTCAIDCFFAVQTAHQKNGQS